MNILFSNQTFLVTGASSGIGREISIKLIASNAKVIGVGRDKDKLDETKMLTADPNNFISVVKDITENMDALPKWIDMIAEQYGKIHGMVLAAGARHTLPLKVLSLEKAKKLFDINFFSNVMLVKGFASSKVNIGKGSSIVFLSSIAAQTGGTGIIDYGSSKAAVNSATKSMALELAKDGIRVNSVMAGYILTNMIKNDRFIYNSEFETKINQEYPLGIGEPKDVANLVCFLLSDLSTWITGSNIIIDGGASLG